MSSEKDLPIATVHAFATLTPDKARSIDEVCDCFEHQLYTRNGPTIEGLLRGFQEPERSILLCELLFLELERSLSRETWPNREEYLHRFPDHPLVVQAVISELFPPASPPAPPSDDVPPTIPNYRILRKLCQGGMGAVYEAMHTELGNLVAIKVLRPNLTCDLEAEARFKREMKIIGTLTHAHIVQARDAGKAGVTHYLVMEYLVGYDLAELVQRLGPLQTADACEIARRVALALAYAHQHNLVHRDIKPKNVLVGRSYGADEPVQVKVVDFGLALLRGSPRPRDASKSSEVVGTFAFMAPEQYWEQTSDIRSDIYSLGCTLYYLLLSRPPFSRVEYRDNRLLMDAHRQAAIPPLHKLRPDVSQPLEALILSMLAKDPRERPTTPIEVTERLGEFTAGYDLGRLLLDAEAPAEDQDAHAKSSAAISRIEDVSQTKTWVKPPPGCPAETPVARSSEAPSVVEPTAAIGRPLLAEPVAASRQPVRYSRRVLLLAAPLAAALIWLLATFGLRFLRPEPVDLLQKVNPARDAVSGEWQLKSDALVSPDAPHARLVLRQSVPAAYRLEIEARRQSGGRLVIGLLRDGRQVPVVLDSAVVAPVPPSNRSAADASRKLAARLGFTGGPSNTYTCIVHPEGLLVAFENQIQLTMGHDDAPPVSADDWRTPRQDALFVGTHNSVYHFHRIMLTPIQP